MGHKLLLVGVLLVSMAGTALAVQTATSPTVNQLNSGWINGPGRNTILVIETTTTALPQALTALGQGFDDVAGPPFTGINLAPYTDVFVGMDGGLVEPSDIQYVANWASSGGHLHFYGGTCWQDYANGMNQYLVQNQTNNYCWTTVGGQPEMRVTDPNNCLATSLPGTYNWNNLSASYYQLRATDPAISVAADNGDGFHMLFKKAIGSGSFDICIDSSYVSYYGDPSDFGVLKQIVWNMLQCGGPVPTKSATWGQVKAIYR